MSTKRQSFIRSIAVAALVLPALWVGSSLTGTRAAGPNVLRVGTFNGIPGTPGLTTIQDAVNAAQPGDWILVGPGDYHERADYANSAHPAGVWIQKSNIHLRGMDRNAVIVDGTKPTASVPCSSNAADQDQGPSGQGRNGIEAYGIDPVAHTKFLADNVSIDNLTVCNFLTGSDGAGNQVWWNGGDGTGSLNHISIGLRGYQGSYLTATSSYSSSTSGSLGPCCGTGSPSASYGIFSSNATGPPNGPANGKFSSITNSYASNQSDSDYYIGACAQQCDVVLDHDHGQYSSLCVSTTNAGGYLVMNHMECDLNKDGPVSNSQNNDDAPSPQIGKCDTAHPSTEPQTSVLGTDSCTVWENGNWHDNNNPNVPGNANGSLAGGGPVGTGVILAGTTYITLYHNTITNNGAWGELIVDLPDPESGPAMCQGGTDVPAGAQTPEVCYYPAFGNLSLQNSFYAPNAGCPTTPTAIGCNGGFGNPTNGDIGLASISHDPGNCFSGDTDASATAGPSTDPAGIETNPAYAPTNNECNSPKPNAGDEGPLVVEALCASNLLGLPQSLPCTTFLTSTVCTVWPSSAGPCPQPLGTQPASNYPHPDAVFTLTTPLSDSTHKLTPTMPNPCAGVPANPWCLTWKLQSTPNPSGATVNGLYGVACPTATQCTAVGSYKNSGNVTVTTAQRWNGSSWAAQTTPNPAGALGSALRRVACPSTSACEAVGYYNNSANVTVTLAERWNGSSWMVQPTPNPAGAQSSTFSTVACASAALCTAVGSYVNGSGATLPLAEGWNGTSWAIQATPLPAGAQSGVLAGVACPSSTQCTAVGNYLNSSGRRLSLAEGWNGSSWAVQSTPNPTGAKSSLLYSVSCPSTTQCNAVGSSVNSAGKTVTLAELGNSGSWTVQASANPAGAQSSVLFGVSCPSTAQCSGVGYSVNSGGVTVTLAELWIGNTWVVQPTPNPAGAKLSQLYSVSCSSTILCTAVWYSVNSANVRVTLAERYS